LVQAVKKVETRLRHRSRHTIRDRDSVSGTPCYSKDIFPQISS
jgi:hypothetical protein